MFDSKRVSELEQRLAIGAQQYGAAQQEIARLNGLLATTTTQRDSLQAFFDAHGGQAVWDQDEVLAAVDQQVEGKRADLAKAEAAVNEATQVSRERVMAAAQETAAQHRREINDLRTTVERLRGEERVLQERLHPMRVEMLDELAAWKPFEHPAEDSIALGVELAGVRKRISALVRTQSAVSSFDETDVPATKAGRTKLSKDTAKLVLRAFNSDVENTITSATATNYETCVNKIQRSAETISRLGQASGVEISPDYIELRLRELRLAVDHLKAKAFERELEREHKAELREQAKAERELEAEKERLEKEKQHYLNVLKVVETQGDQAEAAKLQEQLLAIEKGLNDVENRAANIRAGYVYVISNIGAFGDRMVKIGMTRRLEPMDRVRELGDASVPFGFDVHALFFSEDAVGVEAELHRRFAAQRVNRVNTRREFFYATPAQVRDTLTDVAGNLLEFTDEPEAEQYRLSLAAATNEHGGKHRSTPAATRPDFEWDDTEVN